ncbi:MAG: ribonuclease III [Deltaproteobacteria bacterium]|nr:ribonuclease III [Deltaproteobacteria bacterium]
MVKRGGEEKVVLTRSDRRLIAAFKKRLQDVGRAALGVEVVRESARGKTATQVARALRTTSATVNRWRAKFVRGGLEAIIPSYAVAPAVRKPAPTPFEKSLGYVFVDKAVLANALTHRSYVNEKGLDRNDSNERLEYLGDAVLNLAVSHELVHARPDAPEGDLSRLRASLVNEMALCEIASTLDLGEHIRLGRGEENTGGRLKPSILADALEAVVGAVYVDGGYQPALSLIRTHFSERIAAATAGEPDRDFKTRVQELCQEIYKRAPEYRVVRESGPDHEKVFTVEAVINGDVLGRGTGRSKKEAAQQAAQAAESVLREQSSAGAQS